MNVDEIEAAFEELFVEKMDLTRDGLGEELADIVAQGILRRTIADQRTSIGTALSPNAPDYAARKEKKGIRTIGVGIGPTSGEMLSMEQIKGRREITPDKVVMTYGKSDDVNRKGQWFTSGSLAGTGLEPSGAKGQPPRPFYDIDPETRAKVTEFLERYLQENADRLGF